MFRFLSKKIQLLKLLQQNQNSPGNSHDFPDFSQTQLTTNLHKNLSLLQDILGNSSDVNIREFCFGNQGKTKALLIFIDGLVDTATINESILQTLMYKSRLINNSGKVTNDSLKEIEQSMLSVGDIKRLNRVGDIIHNILSGNSALFIDNFCEAVIISTKGWETRGVQESKTDSVVRGPREGFSENLRTNTALLRRKIKNPGFIIESMTLGKKTQTDICLAYLTNVVNPRLIEEIKRRLEQIKADVILESGYIEQFIEDNPLSPFPSIASNEKPDVIAAKILEGRAAILVDGTPFVLTMPMVLIENFQSADDYYSRPYYASVVRIIRYIAFLVGILAPAIYVALTTYHQELLPTPLLITMASFREGIPFPAMIEALGMGVVFEILREAGIRLPRPVGQAISIVGALVIGESAVSAGLITAPMVIVVAFTAICSFVVPALYDVQVIIRAILVVLAGFMGEFGVVIGLLGVLLHLCALRSFGTPYLSPLAPLKPSGLKDVFVRAPFWLMFNRSRDMDQRDPLRQAFRSMPQQPDKDNE